MDIHELRTDETAAAVAFRNDIFTKVTPEQWGAMDCTAVVACDGEGFAGVIPLQYRNFVLRPGLVAPVVFENAVGVAEARRGQGLGTQMLDAAAEFMADRVDALFVYRGGWRSAGYRFYRKTGHGMLFQESIYRCKPEALEANVQTGSLELLNDIEPQALDLYARCYAGCGGRRERTPGFFRRIWEGHVYRNPDWRAFAHWRDGRLAAYSLVNPHCLKWKECAIYDLAAVDTAALHEVLRGVAAYAAAGDMAMNICASREHPLAAGLRNFGFVEHETTPYIMARIVNPQGLFARLAAGSDLLNTLELRVETPHRDAVLNACAEPEHRAVLRLTESLLSRLLCCRLDFRAALDMGLLNLSPVSPALEEALHTIFAPAPWAPPGIDYV